MLLDTYNNKGKDLFLKNANVCPPVNKSFSFKIYTSANNNNRELATNAESMQINLFIFSQNYPCSTSGAFCGGQVH